MWLYLGPIRHLQVIARKWLSNGRTRDRRKWVSLLLSISLLLFLIFYLKIYLKLLHQSFGLLIHIFQNDHARVENWVDKLRITLGSSLILAHYCLTLSVVMLRLGIFGVLEFIQTLNSSYFFLLKSVARGFSCKIALGAFKLLGFIAYANCAWPCIMILDIHLVVNIRRDLVMMRLTFELRCCWLWIALGSTSCSDSLCF